MAELTDIQKIGPSRAEELESMGYDSVEALASGDVEEIAELDRVSEDMALEFIIAASDMVEESEPENDAAPNTDFSDEHGLDEGGERFDLAPSEVSNEVDINEEAVSGEIDGELEALSETVEGEMAESGGPYDVSLEFENRMQYHTFHDAIMTYYSSIKDSRRDASECMKKLLSEVSGVDNISVTMTEDEINALHTAVKQKRLAYQGQNNIDLMEELTAVESQVDDVRKEKLF